MIFFFPNVCLKQNFSQTIMSPPLQVGINQHLTNLRMQWLKNIYLRWQICINSKNVFITSCNILKIYFLHFKQFFLLLVHAHLFLRLLTTILYLLNNIAQNCPCCPYINFDDNLKPSKDKLTIFSTYSESFLSKSIWITCFSGYVFCFVSINRSISTDYNILADKEKMYPK